MPCTLTNHDIYTNLPSQQSTVIVLNDSLAISLTLIEKQYRAVCF
jgi:hypothetical protein